MLLGCNYHEETEQLVRNGEIDIDYYKFPALGFQMELVDYPELVGFKKFVNWLQETKPVLIHGLHPVSPNVCSKTFDEDLRVDYIKKLLNICNQNGITLHLEGDPDISSEKELIDVAARNIKRFKKIFNKLDFFAIENVDHEMNRFINRPEIINAVVNESGCDFLLDISHAYIVANSLGMDVKEYLHKLPLDNVYEIHINGWQEKSGDIMSHIKINEEAYQLLEYVLDIIEPKLLTIEYGRHNDRIGMGCPVMKHGEIDEHAKLEIIEQVMRVRKMIR